MEVRTARRQESIAARHIRIIAGLFRGMAAGVDLDAEAAQLQEFVEQRGEL
jgi:hypothetical protein